MTIEIPSFQDRKYIYFELRREELTRAAHLSLSVTAISPFGAGNRLSFVYDPLEVRVTKGYAGEVVNGVGIIEGTAFVPGIIDFNDALRFAQGKFEPFGNKDVGWYSRPKVVFDIRNIMNHRLNEPDKLTKMLALNPEAILPELHTN